MKPLKGMNADHDGEQALNPPTFKSREFNWTSVISNVALWVMAVSITLICWIPGGALEWLAFGVIATLYLITWVIIDIVCNIQYSCWKYKIRAIKPYTLMNALSDAWFIIATPFLTIYAIAYVSIFKRK